MGVYIDMEMPPDGRYTVCVTHDSHGVVHWVFQNQDTLEFLKHGAVTEVPEPHGRLGDLDRLAKEVEDMAKEFPLDSIGAERYRLFAEFIKIAPTVIQASEDGET